MSDWKDWFENQSHYSHQGAYCGKDFSTDHWERMYTAFKDRLLDEVADNKHGDDGE